MAENTKKTTLKKYGKIVPVAVAGFVAVSAGTMDAQAEELDINTTDVTPGEEQQTEAAEISTEIKEVTYGDTTTDAETGKTSKEGTVNVGVDADSNVTNDGTITVTETPVSSETTSSAPVTNDDKSTTTTTTETTKSDVTIVSKEDENITSGEIEVDITDEDEDKEKEVQGVIKDQTDISSALKEQYGKDNVKPKDPEYSNGGKTVTETYEVTVTEKSEKEDKPLTDTELKAILKVDDLKAVEGESGTYTYTDETGAAVTVKVKDESKETTTTTWTITVSKTTTTVSGTEDVTSQPVENIKDTPSSEAGTADSAETDSLSVEEILAAAKNGTGEFANATVETNGNGDITRITAGSKTYEFTYSVETETGEKVNISNWTADQIMALLPADKYEKNANGEIVDKAGNVLTFTAENLKQYGVKVSVTLSDKQGIQVDGANSADADDIAKAEADAKDNAEKNAAQNALSYLKNQGIEFDEDAEATQVTDGIWTVTDAEGKQYTFTISVNEETGEETAKWTENPEVTAPNENVASGETHTVTGSAVVESGKVVWTETDGYDNIKLTEEGVVDTSNGLFGEKVVDVDGNKVTTEVTSEDGSVVTTKTYTFTYGAKLTDAEKEQYKDYTDITKITWTVEETTVTTTEDNTGSVITSGGVTWDAEKKAYTFTDKDSGETITLEKGEDGKYTRDDGNGTVYILEEEDVPLADADDATIQAMIAKKYELAEGTKVGINAKKQTATFTKDGAEVTVSYADLKTLTVKKTVTETSDPETLATSGKNGVADMIQTITDTVAGAGENEKYYITVDGTEYQLSVQDGKLVGLVDGAMLENTETITMLTNWLDTRYGVLNGDYLIQYLKDLKKAEQGQDKEIKIGNHIDLVAAGNMDVNGDCKGYVILDGGLQFVWDSSAEQIVEGNGTDIADSLKDNISYDVGKKGNLNDNYWEYAHENGKQVQNQSNKDGQVGIPQTSAYYKVSGKVAYDFVEDYLFESTAKARVNGLKKDGFDNAIWVQVGNHYEVYRYQADLEAYGYMDQDSNVCGNRDKKDPKERGYDLKLQNLTLVDGKVTATVGYSADLTKKTESTSNCASGSSLTLTGETTETTTTRDGVGGSDFSGSYEVTEDLGNMNVKGRGKVDYYTYQTYETTTAEGSAEGTRYDGKLGYTYEVAGEPEVEVTKKTVKKDRVVAVELEKTTEKTEETTTPAPAPTDPGTNPGPGTTPDPDPNPGTNPGPGTTPDPEPADIPDEDVPLTGMPDDEGSLTEIPDGQIPLSETPEDVEIPDEDVPLTEIPDDDVPKTGDASMSWFLAAIASALGLAGLTIADRKRKSEDAE